LEEVVGLLDLSILYVLLTRVNAARIISGHCMADVQDWYGHTDYMTQPSVRT
jgi:hypothetical protein